MVIVVNVERSHKATKKKIKKLLCVLSDFVANDFGFGLGFKKCKVITGLQLTVYS